MRKPSPMHLLRPLLAGGGIVALVSVLTVVITAYPASASANKVVNPNFHTVGPNGSYTLNCYNDTELLFYTAAANWGADCDGLGSGAPSEATDLEHSMLHVSGAVGAGIDQNGLFSVTSAKWSVYVYPTSGPVVACLQQTGNPSGQLTSCDAARTLGQWQQLMGTYGPGPAVDQLAIGSCTPGQVIATTPAFDCPASSALTPPLPVNPSYADFYVKRASVTSGKG
jgi:hypothetical protein